jgi:hypothetical protein
MSLNGTGDAVDETPKQKCFLKSQTLTLRTGLTVEAGVSTKPDISLV